MIIGYAVEVYNSRNASEEELTIDDILKRWSSRNHKKS
jgi:hypothetical protein